MKEDRTSEYRDTTTKERLAAGAGAAALSVPLTFLLNQTEPMQHYIMQAPSIFPYAEYPGIALGFFILGAAIVADARRRVKPQNLNRTAPLH